MLSSRNSFSLRLSRRTPDGNRLAAFAESTFAVWRTPDTVPPLPLVPPTTAPAGSPAFSGAGDISRDGHLLAAGTMAGTVHLLEVWNPDQPLATIEGAPQEVMAVAFSSDGTLLAVGGRDNAVSIWDVTDPRRPRLKSVFALPEDVVLSLEWKPNSNLLAVASADTHAYLVDPDSPHPRARLDGQHSYVYSATFSADGNYLAIGGVDGNVLLWDIRDTTEPQRVGRPIAGPSGRILQLSFHPHNPCSPPASSTARSGCGTSATPNTPTAPPCSRRRALPSTPGSSAPPATCCGRGRRPHRANLANRRRHGHRRHLRQHRRPHHRTGVAHAPT